MPSPDPITTPPATAPHAWTPVRPGCVSIPLGPLGTPVRNVRAGDAVRAGERVSVDGATGGLASVDGMVRPVTLPGHITIETAADFSAPADPQHHGHHDRQVIADQLANVRHAQRGPWFDKVRSAGIVADRHGCPNLNEQLRQALTRPIDTVLCCAIDGESSLPFNSTLLTRFAAELIAGVSVLGRLTGAGSTTVAVDAGLSPRVLAPARHWAQASQVKLTRIANRYPQADPTLLAYSLLKRRLRPGGLPTEVGVVLVDAPAAIAIGSLLITGAPMTTVHVAIRDVMSRQVKRAVAPVGTTVATILAAVGLPAAGITLRGGELLRDHPIGPADPVGHGELTLHTGPPEPPLNPDPCVRSGWCVEICPTRVHPAGLLDAAQRGDHDLANDYNLAACIECGLCTYVCPSKLPLLGAIRQLRAMKPR
jgi:electron transport complex protein RnfC